MNVSAGEKSMWHIEPKLLFLPLGDYQALEKKKQFKFFSETFETQKPNRTGYSVFCPGEGKQRLCFCQDRWNSSKGEGDTKWARREGGQCKC